MLTPGLLILSAGRRDAVWGGAERIKEGVLSFNLLTNTINGYISSQGYFMHIESVADSFPTSSVMSCTRARIQTAVKSSARGAAASKSKAKRLRSPIKRKRIDFDRHNNTSREAFSQPSLYIQLKGGIYQELAH